MSDVDQDALRTFYQEEFKFHPGVAVSVYLHYGEERYGSVQELSVLVLAPDMQLLKIRTPKAKYIFREWSGVGIDYTEGARLQLS